MAVDSGSSSAGAGGLDLNTLLQQAMAGGTMSNIFGGSDNMGGIGGGLVYC